MERMVSKGMKIKRTTHKWHTHPSFDQKAIQAHFPLARALTLATTSQSVTQDNRRATAANDDDDDDGKRYNMRLCSSNTAIKAIAYLSICFNTWTNGWGRRI